MGRERAAFAEGFPERLRELRRSRGLSQTELGDQVGLHYTHIGRYERGKSRPGADTLQRLAEVLGVSSDYLMEGNVEDAARARLDDAELLHLFQEVEKLDPDDKDVIKKLINAFLTKKQIQALAR